MRSIGLALCALTLIGCSSSIPPAQLPDVGQSYLPDAEIPADVKATAGAILSPDCLALLSEAQYQNQNQFWHAAPVFAFALSADKHDMVCAYAAQSLIRVVSEGNRATALARCEEAKPIWEHANKMPLGACQIFAKGNSIVYQPEP